MRIGIYCNKENKNDIIALFREMFPKHRICVDDNITDGSFITTTTNYKIVMYDFANPERYEYEVITIDEFYKRYPFVKGDIVRWHDYDDPYKIIAIRGLYQKVSYEIMANDGCVYTTYVESLSYYNKNVSDITDKDIIVKNFKNIISLIKDKKYNGEDYSDWSVRDIMDFVCEISENALSYIKNRNVINV